MWMIIMLSALPERWNARVERVSGEYGLLEGRNAKRWIEPIMECLCNPSHDVSARNSAHAPG